MSNALVVKAAQLIGAGDIAGAEYALVSLVDAEGDHALVEVLEELPPKDLLAIIREFDSSKESVINLLVTPEQFARTVIMERLYADRTHGYLRSMINSVIFRDEDETAEFIEAIGALDGGCEALVDYLTDRDEEVLHFLRYDTFNLFVDEESDAIERAEACDGDWKEMTWRLKHEHPDMFEQIWPVLKNRMRERLRQEAEEEAERIARAEGAAAAEAPAKVVPAKPAAGPAEESAL
ncbi:hypothetical protein VVD49_14155 [Uliginosibacterium sp. H3]|uniref:Magnesium transporter n=1 Tax=Uliginosibacterium silvisoli TaxID=3114758 RepID=A0ABU6K4Z5_9RHOO|nr:hypothetical protein [Uliginosibacterium sp. H3]